jgi:hypothetical protein
MDSIHWLTNENMTADLIHIHTLYAVLVRLVLHLGKAIYQDQILTQWHVRIRTVKAPTYLKIKNYIKYKKYIYKLEKTSG